MFHRTFSLAHWLLVSIGSICLLVIFSTDAKATGFSLSVDPPILYIQANPPAEVSTPIHVTNHEDSAVTLAIDLAPFTAKNDTGEISFIDEQLAIAPLVKILYKDKEVKEVSLASLQTIDLLLVASIPKDYQGKAEQYFSIVFSSKNVLVPRTQISQRESQEVYVFSQLKPGIATNVIFSIGPLEKIRKSSLGVDFQTQALREKGPVDFRLTVSNHSKKAIGLQGEIFVQNLFGQTIGKVELPLQYVLSEKTRSYSNISWPETVLLGPYRSMLVLKDPYGQLVLTRTIVFLGLPYQATIELFIIFWIIVLIVMKIRKRLRA